MTHQIILIFHLLAATVWVGGHLFLSIRYLPEALKKKDASILINFKDKFEPVGLPSLLTFNHVIVKINYKGESYFVDATLRDEFGLIENRGFIFFLHYLEVKPNLELQHKPPHRFPYYALD